VSELVRRAHGRRKGLERLKTKRAPARPIKTPVPRAVVTELYRHFDVDGRLLYVGISRSSKVRLSRHRRSHWFGEIVRIEIERYPTRQAAEAAEIAAIRLEKPLYNVVHTRGTLIDRYY
jgi:hypothetical protein